MAANREEFTFAPATKTKQKLKMAISGPSGSGKTYGALHLAFALSTDGKVAVLDTENKSASLYADLFPPFDTLSLGPPYTSRRYAQAINAAIAAGYEVLVVDSLSHQWQGPGGILNRKEEVDQRGGDKWSNWKPFSDEHTKFLNFLLHADIHLVCTMRAKQEYLLEAGGDGKKAKLRKMGMAPVQREGTEYEFTTVFDLQMDHRALASKDRTHLFEVDGEPVLVDLASQDFVQQLRGWLNSGAEPDPIPTVVDPVAASEGRVAAAAAAEAKPAPAARRTVSPRQSAPAPAAEPAAAPAPAAKPAPKPAAKPAPQVQEIPEDAEDPPPPAECPKCGGEMWDNRSSKRSPRAPDYKCKDKGCDGLYWSGQWPPKPKEDDGQRDAFEDGQAAGVSMEPDDDLPF